MLKRYPYILLFCFALLSNLRVAGQMVMPDNVYVGQTRHYNVDPNPVAGSTYTWRIDGVVQIGFTSNSFDNTWSSPGTYLLEIQELSADRCLGPVRSGQVFVNPFTALTASWTLTISAAESDYDAIGDVLHYTIRIDNTGDLPISNIIVTLTGADAGSTVYVSGDNNGNNSLDPSETWIYSSTHTVVQADINADHYANTATATGTHPGGSINPASDNENVTALQRPALTITKSALETNYQAAGDVIHYTLIVTNTGNVTLTGVVLNDPDAVVTCVNAPYTLSPGASIACSAIHTVTSADFMAGRIRNVAVVTGIDPNNLPVIENSNEVTVSLRNLAPEIRISLPDTVLCDGESFTISVQNPNTSVRGQWMYNLTVEPDAGITGNTISGTYTNTTNLIETLFNNDTRIHKLVYRFTPRIVPDDGGPDCFGKETQITVWVHPRLRYTKELSDYNGFNISCYGLSNGYIKIDPSPELSPYSFRWSGPNGFNSSIEDITGLIAGQYNMAITDCNGCTVTETFDLTEPKRLSMTIDPSISSDGAYNINCAGASTGSVTVSALNNVGLVDYLWIDGAIGSKRTNMSAGIYKVIITDSNNCQADSSLVLTEPESIKIGFEVTNSFCPEKPDGEIRLTVSGGISNDYTFSWSNKSTEMNLSGITAGKYVVTVTDQNLCSVKDSVRVNPLHDICLIIPEAISPNEDLINDNWKIGNIELYQNVEITIYNRWGQVVWESDHGYTHPWDGRSNGINLPVDAFHYVIDLHNGSKLIVGAVTLVR